MHSTHVSLFRVSHGITGLSFGNIVVAAGSVHNANSFWVILSGIFLIRVTVKRELGTGEQCEA